MDVTILDIVETAAQTSTDHPQTFQKSPTSVNKNKGKQLGRVNIHSMVNRKL